MSILDELEVMDKLDAEQMAPIIRDFPDQVERATQLAQEAELKVTQPIDNLAILGMGGSAIGGDLLAAALWNTSPVAVATVRAYNPPLWIGKNTLVMASSYSGNTHEMLSSLRAVLPRQPQVLAVTSGGKLQEMAQENDWTLVTVPAGNPPRASMGYMFVPLLVMASRLGLYPDPQDELEELVALLREKSQAWGREASEEDNVAKQLAFQLLDRPIFVYGTEGPLAAAAYRWRGQIQENAKMLVSSHAFPEFCHNEITGYEKPQSYVRDAAVVVLRDDDEPIPHQAQVDASAGIMGDATGELIELWGEGSSKLIRALMLIYLGDWVSYYLAMLNGVDPTSIRSIIAIKAAINKRS